MFKFGISVNPDTGATEVSMVDAPAEFRKRNKGKSLLVFPDEYIVFDTETTGLDPEYCEVIEFAGVKYRDGQELDRFQSLIRPVEPIDSFITGLTGITNEMLNEAPTPEDILSAIADFIGDNILVAHNAHFDVNFLYDNFENHLGATFANDFVCTMRLCRRLFPDYRNHKLKTICQNMQIDLPNHRALGDALAAGEVYRQCKHVVESTIGISEFERHVSKKHGVKASDITSSVDYFDTNHPIFGKNCVFTGALSKMVRKEAMQMVVNLGGICSDGVNKDTDFLIMGIQDYSKFADGEKSSKTKKAESLMMKGHDIEIISENIFYEMILQEA